MSSLEEPSHFGLYVLLFDLPATFPPPEITLKHDIRSNNTLYNLCLRSLKNVKTRKQVCACMCVCVRVWTKPVTNGILPNSRAAAEQHVCFHALFFCIFEQTGLDVFGDQRLL